MGSGTPQTRELAARESDVIHVLLLWHPHKNALTLSVEDARVRDHLQFAIAPDCALDALYHPFAHMHWMRERLHHREHVPTLHDLEQAAHQRGDLPAATRLAALAKARGARSKPCRTSQ